MLVLYVIPLVVICDDVVSCVCIISYCIVYHRTVLYTLYHIVVPIRNVADCRTIIVPTVLLSSYSPYFNGGPT